PEQHWQEGRASQQRERDIILDHLAARLAHDTTKPGQRVTPAVLATPRALQLDVVDGDTPLEESRQYRVVQRLDQGDGVPWRLRGDSQRAVPDVPVLTEHVGVRVMDEVVRVLPHVSR